MVAGIRKQSEEDDASLADLTPFEQRGGSCCGASDADTTIPTEASVLLYRRIVDAMGQARVDGFARLYLVPGFGHGRGLQRWVDTIGVLDAWADQGSAPANLVVTDENEGSARTRPLCAWPSWPSIWAVM